MTRIGYQIPNFTYPDLGNDQIFDEVLRQAKEAEAAGFDRVLVMDHFYQLPGIGAPDEPMFEAYTLLSAIAQHTETVRLGTLVTGNTYRNPALLAKTITALDHVSHGRATLGIGAGWFELEHDSLGFAFNTFTERFEKLEESLQIITGMLAGEKPTLAGKHYTVDEAVNSPAPVSKIPLMIGGGGEKKTLRMVAQYADESNLICDNNEIAHKVGVLNEHCKARGRDRGEVTVTKLMNCVMAPTIAEADAELSTMLAVKGMAGFEEAVKPMILFGDPDAVAAQLQTAKDDGLQGVTLNLPLNGHIPGRITELAEVASAVFPA